jgi:hypothetical protein
MENNAHELKGLTQKLVNALNASGHAWDCALNPHTVTGSGEADFVEFDGTEVCTCGQDELMTEAKAMGFTPQ